MCPASRKAAPFTPAPFALGCTLPQDRPDCTSVPISTGPEGQVVLLGARPLQPCGSPPACRGRASRVPLAFTPFAHPGSWAAPWIRTLSGSLPLDNLQCLGLAEAIVRERNTVFSHGRQHLQRCSLTSLTAAVCVVVQRTPSASPCGGRVWAALLIPKRPWNWGFFPSNVTANVSVRPKTRSQCQGPGDEEHMTFLFFFKPEEKERKNGQAEGNGLR